MKIPNYFEDSHLKINYVVALGLYYKALRDLVRLGGVILMKKIRLNEN